MSVRWKPLIILSCLFSAFAVVGVLAFFLVFSKADATDILAQAREARERKEFPAAEIFYKQALQLEPRNAAIFEELAGCYEDWIPTAKDDARPTIEAQRLRALQEAAQHDKTALEPRRALLTESLMGDDPQEQGYWAKQVLGLSASDPDARYVLAANALAMNPPNLAEAQTQLETLQKTASREIRTAWVAAAIANASSDSATLKTVLDKVREVAPNPKSPAIDRVCHLRLMVFDLQNATANDDVAGRADAVVKQTKLLIEEPGAPTHRVVEVGKMLKLVEAIGGVSDDPNAKAKIDELAAVLETGYRNALEKDANAGLWLRQSYADHLASHGRNDECLKVAVAALAMPQAKQAAFADEIVRLHETALKAILSNEDDPDRFTKIEPHIRGLLNGPRPEHQGLGHLYQGAISLERSGLAGKTVGAETATSDAARMLVDARKHLKEAATRLPSIAQAQALYGVALILSDEPSLGRQYLQDAQRLGALEARYQVWAAWSMLRAGYPEEAEPVVVAMQQAVEKGELSADLGDTLALLRGEIAQARRSPKDLEMARTAFEKVAADGGETPPGVALRLAELAVEIDGPEKGLEKVMALRATGQGGAAAEHLAATTLVRLGRDEEAKTILQEARAKYPESSPLVSLDAGLLLRDDKAEAASELLGKFLADHPDDVAVSQLQARILVDPLKKTDEARALLSQLADRTENSGPLVQLALVELTVRNLDGAAQAVAKIRGRWPELAVADMLDAQIAVSRQDLAGAARHLDDAIKKDPNNKVARFWKAQIEDRNGDVADASRAYEEIVRSNPVKELSNGLTLGDAAQWAMGSLALNNNDIDGAIERFESILQGDGSSRLARLARWKLVAARFAKGDWTTTRAEIADLLDDPEVTLDERTQAANYFRQKGEQKTAEAQIDFVLKQDPDHPGAVVLKAFGLTEAKQYDEAAELLSSAAEAEQAPAAISLMLAGVERARQQGQPGYDAAIAALDRGLVSRPTSAELIRARYALVRTEKGVDEALKSIEERAKADETGKLKPVLVELYRSESKYAEARPIVEEMLKADPKNARLAATMVSLVVNQATQARDRNDREAEQNLDLEGAGLIRKFREQFPDDLRFVQAACEQAMRRGDYTEAENITRQIDQIDPGSAVASVLRGRLYEEQGWPDRAVTAYLEGVNRSPQRDDVRLKVAELQLELGRPDEALTESTRVLRRSPSNPRAMLVQASALAAQPGSPEQVTQRREEAIKGLIAAIRENPEFLEAYHKVAEIHLLRGRRDQAIESLKRAMAVEPKDTAGLSLLIQYLAQALPDGSSPAAGELEEANSLATTYADADETGLAALAAGIGFYKAGRLELSLPWTEKAAEKLDDPTVHTTLGDLLLTMADAETDESRSRPLYERAVSEYDKVLAVQSTRVEAVNNKAWILHKHLGRDSDALELAQGLVSRVERNTLPAEFFDTIGSIQEALGRPKDAEDAYNEGLGKSPQNAVLNYHLGRLIASDSTRAARAGTYLEQALAFRDQLSPEMAVEAEALLKRVGH